MLVITSAKAKFLKLHGKIINAIDFGVKANDNLDDSKALLKALKAANCS